MRPVTLVDGLGPIAAASVATVLFEATVTSTAEVPALLAHDGATNNGIAISIHRHRLPPRTLIQSRSTQLSAHLTSPGTTRSASSTLSVPLGRQVRQKVGAVLRRSISAGMGRIHNDREAPTSALGSLGHLAHRHERQHNAVADERTPNQLGFSPLDELGGNVGRRRCPPRSGRAGVPARSQVCEEGLELLVGLEDVGSPLFVDSIGFTPWAAASSSIVIRRVERIRTGAGSGAMSSVPSYAHRPRPRKQRASGPKWS